MRSSSLCLAGIVVAVLSAGAASAQDVDVKKLLAMTRTAAAWKSLSYAECRAVALELGWTQLETWYGCSTTPRK